MSQIDTLKLNADLLAMHDQPMRPDAADLNTLRDAMTIVTSHRNLEEQLREAMRYIGECSHTAFSNPVAVVAFWERNERYAEKRAS